MGNQRTFASIAWQAKGKVTRRERFLAEMDAVIPWTRLFRLIAPHYPKAGNGRQPRGMEKMLRIYFLQHDQLLQRRIARPDNPVEAIVHLNFVNSEFD
jgi:hypothetical protein